MNERAGTRTKAEEARAQRKFARSRTIRRVAFASVALFAVVFALLSFRLAAGLDPTSQSTVATSGQPENSATSTPTDDDYDYESDDDQESWSSSDSSTSNESEDAGQSQSQSSSPTTGAS